MKLIITILLFMLYGSSNGQSYDVVNTFDELEKKYFLNNDTTYVINFWATWCKPCVKELPYLEEYNSKIKGEKKKVILVSLDFEKQINSHFKPFLKKKKIASSVVLLKDKNYNNWVESLDSSWSGSIPATLVINGKKRAFYEGEFHSVRDIQVLINQLK